MKQKDKNHRKNILEWPALLRGRLINRYQRFKADVRLQNGHVVTALCPNTGRMLTCSDPGRDVYISRQNSQNRKLKYTWEIIEMPDSFVGINTNVPNRLVRQSILNKEVPELKGYDAVKSEVPYGSNSRIDILLEKGEAKCFVEVKNCTLVEKGIASFPDAVTSRGLKHLKELRQEILRGNRAVMFYLIQRMDAKEFMPAYDIDQAYSMELMAAHEAGVEIIVYDVIIDLKGVSINSSIPYRLTV